MRDAEEFSGNSLCLNAMQVNAIRPYTDTLKAVIMEVTASLRACMLSALR